MISVELDDLKEKLIRTVRKVSEGEPVTILKDGQPVAIIVPAYVSGPRLDAMVTVGKF